MLSVIILCVKILQALQSSSIELCNALYKFIFYELLCVMVVTRLTTDIHVF